MQRATLYKHDNMLYIQASSQTTEGFWIGNEYVEKVDISAIKEIEEKINEALSKSETGLTEKVSENSDLDELVKPLLELCNIPTWGKFIKNTKCIHVSKKDNILKFMPTKRNGKSFNHLPKQSVEVNNNLYESLIQCLDLSK